jgi:hypothetical protein
MQGNYIAAKLPDDEISSVDRHKVQLMEASLVFIYCLIHVALEKHDTARFRDGEHLANGKNGIIAVIELPMTLLDGFR